MAGSSSRLATKPAAKVREEIFYATIDEIGRYRVKLPFDLDTWNPGGDSRPVRLAKAYAGSHYGIHFPLHSSVEVALGFTNGDPNRPYIAHVFHDSNHEDHVNNQWSTRNIIRTWGKNKLCMEDYKGKEHIKLATEFHKTQLNLGHLVDAKREQRGEGFELRTDGWGVVRSAKGLFLSADSQSGAIGQTRDMAAAKSQIDAANGLTKNLSKSAGSVGAEMADIQAQIDLLNEQINDFKQAALLASAPAGMALTTAASAHIGAGDNLSLVAGGTQSWTALKNLVGLAGGAVSFFAQKLGIKLIANQGKIDIQAQNDAMTLAALKDLNITSSAGVVTMAAKKNIVLACGGGYLKIHPSGEVEIGSPVKLTIKAPLYSDDPASLDLPLPNFKGEHDIQFVFKNKLTNQPEPYKPYVIWTESGEKFTGLTDKEGKTQIVFTQSPTKAWANLTIKEQGIMSRFTTRLRIDLSNPENSDLLKMGLKAKTITYQLVISTPDGDTQIIPNPDLPEKTFRKVN
jgi:type VI secretion system secreted protein VgrG